jgi:hypothetical protein
MKRRVYTVQVPLQIDRRAFDNAIVLYKIVFT